MNRKFLLWAPALCVFALCLAGCSPALKISVNNTADVSVNFSEKSSAVLESVLVSVAGLAQGEPLVTRDIAVENMRGVGFEVTDYSQTGNDIALETKKKNLRDNPELLQKAVGLYTQTVRNSKENLCIVTFSPQFFSSVFRMMNEETQGYIDLLMAPSFTGEEMTPEEYIDLLAVVYGNSLADAAEKSTFDLILQTDGKITASVMPEGSSATASVSGISAQAVKFTIPLAEFLTNTGTASYSVSWK
ncbi:MAG: hypothetical protein MJ183_09270 [Treponemataceae bacterium]|nr:hypothetical protein [Treponemataceae bacterium]